jgi:hypothetical protein
MLSPSPPCNFTSSIPRLNCTLFFVYFLLYCCLRLCTPCVVKFTFSILRVYRYAAMKRRSLVWREQLGNVNLDLEFAPNEPGDESIA